VGKSLLLEAIAAVWRLTLHESQQTCRRVCHEEQWTEKFVLANVNAFMDTQERKDLVTFAKDDMAESDS